MAKRRTFLERARYKIVAIGGAIIAIGGSIAAAPRIEPYIAAHRGYVRDRIELAQSGVLPVLRDVQIEINEGKREAAQREKRALMKELEVAKDIAHKNRIENDIAREQLTIDRLNSQIETIRKLK